MSWATGPTAAARSGTLGTLGAQNLAYNTNDWLTTDIYDRSGNTRTNGANTFTYDVQNRLTAAALPGKAITVQYNGDGVRASETANGVTIRYLVAERNPTGYAQVLEETDNSGLGRVTGCWECRGGRRAHRSAVGTDN
jgi:YD repeat-containing protein